MGNAGSADRELLPAGIEWRRDECASHCYNCRVKFGIFCRRHHCRKCGDIFCHVCSRQRAVVRTGHPAVRICKPCHHPSIFKLARDVVQTILQFLRVTDLDRVLRVCHQFQLQPQVPYRHIASLEALYDFHAQTDPIGQGSYGIVYRAACRNTQRRCAIKVINKNMIFSMRAWDDVQREIRLLDKIRHQHCVGLYTTLQSESQVFIVMELAEGHQLFQAIIQRGRLSEADVAGVATQLLRTLQYLHSRNVVHRDIKPENIIVTPDLRHLKLVDFGFARYFGPKEELAYETGAPLSILGSGDRSVDVVSSPLGTTPCGTLHYAAPEVIRGVVRNHNVKMKSRYHLPKLDIFSAGIVTYLMLCGELPFSGESIMGLRTHHRAGKPALNGRAWHSVSSEAKELVRQMLDLNPEERPSAGEAMSSTWILSHIQPGRTGLGFSQSQSLVSPNVLSSSLHSPQFASRLRELMDMMQGEDLEKPQGDHRPRSHTVADLRPPQLPIEESTPARRRHSSFQEGLEDSPSGGALLRPVMAQEEEPLGEGTLSLDFQSSRVL